MTHEIKAVIEAALALRNEFYAQGQDIDSVVVPKFLALIRVADALDAAQAAQKAVCGTCGSPNAWMRHKKGCPDLFHGTGAKSSGEVRG